jgi:hypothetical protein
MSRRGRHRGESPLPLVREAVAAALAPVAVGGAPPDALFGRPVVLVDSLPLGLPDAIVHPEFGPPREGEPLRVTFTESKSVFRYTLDAVRGVGTVMVAREDGLCERTVTYDSQRWVCACGVSGEVARSNDGIPYVDDEVLAHAPGDRS